MDASNTIRIAVFGKSGAGKSSLANTIFGEDQFKIYHSAKTATKECQSETRSVGGRSITLIDTPGFSYTDGSEEELMLKIMSCMTECAPGPHAFLIVLKVERFTEQEQAVINKIQEYLSEEASKYATVVFTHGDELPEGETIEKLVSENKPLDDLVKKCGGRCHVVDNKYWKDKPKHEYRSNQFQVEELLKTIDTMVTENNGGCYTNEMLQKVEQMIKREEEKIRQSPGNMTEEEIRKKARSRVCDRFLSDVGTGTSLETFFGVVVSGVYKGLIRLTGIFMGAVKKETKKDCDSQSAGNQRMPKEETSPEVEGGGAEETASVSNTMRIAVFGKSGAGKSSLANTIFGEDQFKIYHSAKTATKECQSETRSVGGRSITLIDTPGFSYTDGPEEELKRKIMSCMTECAPGPHAFLIVLKVERFTEQEQEVINTIQEYLSEEAFKYATVVFTHGDELPEGETIEKLVSENKPLDDLVKKCGGRCHVVDNKYWKEKPEHEYRSNQFQVEELLKTIDKMVVENNGGCYTNEMLQDVEKMIEQEEEKIRLSPGNMTEEEIRKKAKSRVCDRLLSDVGTGASLETFFGVVVSGVYKGLIRLTGTFMRAVKKETKKDCDSQSAGNQRMPKEETSPEVEGGGAEETASASNTIRIAVFGKTGAGKSSLANTIFGEDAFRIYHKFKSGTRECQLETRSVSGRSITLVDTPGLFDTDRPEEEMKPEIVSCITECAPGPHAFLIVLKVEKFTEQEQAVINTIQEYFSEEAFKYATVLFTHGDQLPEGETIDKLVSENKPLDDLVKKCGGRCHVIDNKYWKNAPKHEYRSNQFQVEELLKTLGKMVTENNAGCYTNEMLQKVEEKIQQEEENIRQSPGNMTEVEIRKKAKSRVFDWLLSALADVGTGPLLRTFLGVVVTGGLVILCLKK
ncbi:GTPase IMAP family member 8-like [Acanthopagrus schlegelii]